MKKTIRKYYMGHLIDVTITETFPEMELENIPDTVKELIKRGLEHGDENDNEIYQGEFDHEETMGNYQIEGVEFECSFKGSWKILDLNYGIFERLFYWEYNRLQEESLNEDLFIQYFGLVYGKHLYKKWTDEFKFNYKEMLKYFHNSGSQGQDFCNMIMEQVEKFEARKNNSN